MRITWNLSLFLIIKVVAPKKKKKKQKDTALSNIE
jgi:hypothetical protein